MDMRDVRDRANALERDVMEEKERAERDRKVHNVRTETDTDLDTHRHRCMGHTRALARARCIIPIRVKLCMPRWQMMIYFFCSTGQSKTT